MKDIVAESFARVRANGGDEHSPEYLRRLAAGMMIRASLALGRYLDSVLRPVGLTFARYHVLAVVEHSPGQRLPQNEIAEDLCLHISSVTGHIDRLVERGFVMREQDPGNRRTTFVRLTFDGQRTYNAGRMLLEQHQSGLSQLEPEPTLQLSLLLQEALNSLRHPAGPQDHVG